jgi:2-polyprenyl-3-methyl-5-hydroxy-6-metoxy-1,4-benzoquinol methylase
MKAAKMIHIDDNRQFPSFSLDEVHYKVMDLTGPLPPGKALDMPAGPGRLSWCLHNRGFNVIAGDIMPIITLA